MRTNFTSDVRRFSWLLLDLDTASLEAPEAVESWSSGPSDSQLAATPVSAAARRRQASRDSGRQGAAGGLRMISVMAAGQTGLSRAAVVTQTARRSVPGSAAYLGTHRTISRPIKPGAAWGGAALLLVLARGSVPHRSVLAPHCGPEPAPGCPCPGQVSRFATRSGTGHVARAM